jgi:1-acyl-sn-glycerol-3-phosphate acyltransferase
VKLRGYVALLIVCVALILADLVQRFVIRPWVTLRPSRRVVVLGGWINFMARLVTRPLVRIGGARIPVPERLIPAEPGVLILMNHQSLFDIPLVIQTVEGGYPRIVTRARYAARWIPVISHMIELYQYPVVDPSANSAAIRESLDHLEAEARATEVPLVVFPEGTRTRDGEIGGFKRGALARILAARTWTVYVFVADGFWKAPRFKEFVRGLPHVDGRMAHVATLEWQDPSADPNPFLDQVRDQMVEHLAALRGRAEVA